ncbi:hypothetical protein K8I31_04165, partial [bacterium]|nr:hypothetical protein [bacterium]
IRLKPVGFYHWDTGAKALKQFNAIAKKQQWLELFAAMKEDVHQQFHHPARLSIVFISVISDFGRTVVGDDDAIIYIFMTGDKPKVYPWLLLHELLNVFGGVDIKPHGFVLNDDTVIDDEWLKSNTPQIHSLNKKILFNSSVIFNQQRENWWNFRKLKYDNNVQAIVDAIYEMEPILSHERKDDFFRVGQMFRNNEMFEESIKPLQKAVQYAKEKNVSSNELQIVCIELMKSYVKLGRVQDAIDLVDELYEKEPNSIAKLRLVSDVYYEADDYGKCIELYSQMLERTPRDSTLYYRKALCLVMQTPRNRWKDEDAFARAIELLNTSIKIGANGPELYALLQRIYATQGNVEQAAKYQRILDERFHGYELDAVILNKQ